MKANAVPAWLTKLWTLIARAFGRRERRSLTSTGCPAGPELLVQAARVPVVYDDWPGGFDYVCGHCRKSVIGRCVTDGQLWDLSFECFRCKGISLSPVLPLERALPHCCVPPPGRTDVAEGIDLRRITLAGQDAVDRRQAVAGVKGSTLGYRAHRPPAMEGNAALLESVIKDVQQLLGAAFDDLKRVDPRKRTSKHRHPLMGMIEALRADIPTFATTTPSVHVDYLMELLALLQAAERWQRHPFWPEMLRGLHGRTEYPHTAILLAAATYFEDTGNNVEFNETGLQRTPDLFLVLGPRQRVAVEVKVPNVLRGPPAPLGRDRLLAVVDTSMKKARSGRSGQLSRDYAAILVIGGFRTWRCDLTDFQRAAAAYLQKTTKVGRHPHLLSIGLLTLATMIRRGPTKTDAQPGVQMTSEANPGYRGDIKLITATPPHLRRPSE